MRLSRLVLLGLLAGVALWLRRHGRVAARRLAGPATRAMDAVVERVPSVEPDLRMRETIEDLVEPAPAGSIVGDVVQNDPAALVGVERELLTVPDDDGSGHRRRDQTAGVAAQEIAAAQVRARRNGV